MVDVNGGLITSLAMVVMKAGGRAVAIRERAWRAERAESAGGLSGRPVATLQRDGWVSLTAPELA